MKAPTVVDVASMPKLYGQFLLLFPIRVEAILESLADDHCPFCPTMYCLTTSSDTDPTEAMNPERVHLDDKLDFIQGYSLRIV